MEIDIFPIPSAKEVHRYIGTSFLGLIINHYLHSWRLQDCPTTDRRGQGTTLLSCHYTYIYRRICGIRFVASWHQAVSLCLLQKQQKGVEQSSRPREHGCLHHKAYGGHSKEAGNKACCRNTTM